MSHFLRWCITCHCGIFISLKKFVDSRLPSEPKHFSSCFTVHIKAGAGLLLVNLAWSLATMPISVNSALNVTSVMPVSYRYQCLFVLATETVWRFLARPGKNMVGDPHRDIAESISIGKSLTLICYAAVPLHVWNLPEVVPSHYYEIQFIR